MQLRARDTNIPNQNVDNNKRQALKPLGVKHKNVKTEESKADEPKAKKAALGDITKVKVFVVFVWFLGALRGWKTLYIAVEAYYNVVFCYL